MTQISRFLLMFVCLSWHSAFAAEPASLQIRPHTCVTDQNGVCDVSVQLRYESPRQQAVCFLIAAKDLRFCQPNASQHELTVHLVLSANTQIEVVDADNGQVLGSSMLTLASYEPNSTRKRRRFAWSFDQ